MARPKRYHTEEELRQANAQRQASWRARRKVVTVVVPNSDPERLTVLLDRLQAALYQAKKAGDPIAGRCYQVSAEETLEALVAHFEEFSLP